ncbi:MAG: hypothetical protein ACYSU7_04885, partial [Planctomycetota bacterium]
SREWQTIDATGFTDAERNPAFVFADRHVDSRARRTFSGDNNAVDWFTGTSNDPYLPDFSRR